MSRFHLRGTVAVLFAVAMLATACRSESEPSADAETDTPISEEPAAEDGGDFGTLENVCQDGDASGSTAQGVTDDEIQLGVLTDVGFTQNSEFVDAAEAFTSWCNDAGGINGRQLTFEVRDAKLFEYRQRIIDACAADFMLVGGGAAFDGNGVRDRLQCLLPEITAQNVAYENEGSGLQIEPAVNSHVGIVPYEGYYKWLLTEQYPETADAVGIIAGDIGSVKLFAQRETETIEFHGAQVVYNDVYPASGVSDWQPYALALKEAGVKGLIFEGAFGDLAKLEQSLADVDHDVTWIDANTNAYNQQFIELAGPVLDRYENYSAPTIVPLEAADEVPAMAQFIEIMEQYKPDANITGPMIQAWSAWLNFAVAARDCEADVTRRCVFENAMSYDDWRGGGISSPNDLSDPGSRRVCFVVMEASPDGWGLADFGADDGIFRCEDHEYTPQGDYPEPVTLDDVGLTIDDLD